MLDKFHKACQNIVDNAHMKAVSYAVNYAKGGLIDDDPANVHTRAVRLIGNITHWRGDVAKETRAILKEIIAAG